MLLESALTNHFRMCVEWRTLHVGSILHSVLAELKWSGDVGSQIVAPSSRVNCLQVKIEM